MKVIIHGKEQLDNRNTAGRTERKASVYKNLELAQNAVFSDK